MTAPIYLNIQAARSQLQREKLLYTLRRPRGVGVAQARQGGYYEFEPLGWVEIVLIQENATDDQLVQYLPSSGFPSIQAWRIAAGPDQTHLYRVSVKIARRDA